ncbi:MAG TPA: TIGR02266 family protein [Myxococcota bacterium]|jgi:type IV pilus assembly protein PilZ|nr:TIGR02266 family protein [Myxococcota bacterium]
MAKAQIEQGRKRAGSSRGVAGNDKRRSSRERLVVRVDYSTVDAFFSEFTANINEGGLFIETDSPAPVGTQVLLKFQLPGTEEPLKVSGRVIWTTPGSRGEVPGMGIEFEDLDPSARDRVNAVVRRLRSHGSGDTAARR